MLHDRIKSLRKSTGLSAKKFAELIGVKYTTYYGYESGNSEPDADFICVLADRFNVSTDYILCRENVVPPQISVAISSAACRIGRAYEKATPPVQRTVEVALEPYMDEQSKKGQVTANFDESCISIIVYDQPAAAGLGNYLDGTTYEEIEFPENSVPRGTDFAVLISGNSMEPKYSDGCVVFVKSQPVIEDGQIGIFSFCGESYCKMLKIDRARKQVFLVSLNPAYEDIIVDDPDNLRTVGRVLGSAEIES